MKKKIIALLLVLAMLMGCAVPAFAADEAASSIKSSSLPFIMVRGMDFGGLTYAAGTDEEQNCLGEIKATEIVGVVLKTIASGLIHRSWDAAADVAIEYAQGLMGLMACDKQGNSLYDVSVSQFPLALSNYPEFTAELDSADELGILKEAVDEYGAENVYYYNYDWRLDPYYHAGKINELINQALADHPEAGKVNLVCCSMGGIETVSYIYKYGAEKLNRIVFLSSTATGTHVTSDILSGKVDIEPEILYNYCENNTGGALRFLVKVLYKTKVLAGVLKLVNNTLIPNLRDRVYDKLLTPVFGTIPAIWALVLPEQYDECIDYMFGGKEAEYADFIALTEEYQIMAAKRDDMLKAAEAAGTSMCFVSGYGQACVPVYTGGNCNGDSILEADRCLGEAVVAPLNSTLGDDYTAADPVRLSPDRMVDLSPVIFPDCTWAVRGAKHVGCSYGTDMSEFLFTLVNYDGRVTVDTFPQYPQFMVSTGTDIVR